MVGCGASSLADAQRPGGPGPVDTPAALVVNAFVDGVLTGGASAPAGQRGRPGQAVAQLVPLRVKAVGAALVDPLAAVKPTVTEPLAGMVEV